MVKKMKNLYFTAFFIASSFSFARERTGIKEIFEPFFLQLGEIHLPSGTVIPLARLSLRVKATDIAKRAKLLKLKVTLESENTVVIVDVGNKGLPEIIIVASIVDSLGWLISEYNLTEFLQYLTRGNFKKKPSAFDRYGLLKLANDSDMYFKFADQKIYLRCSNTTKSVDETESLIQKSYRGHGYTLRESSKRNDENSKKNKVKVSHFASRDEPRTGAMSSNQAALSYEIYQDKNSSERGFCIYESKK